MDNDARRIIELECDIRSIVECILSLTNILEDHEYRLDSEVADRREAITQLERPQ